MQGASKGEGCVGCSVMPLILFILSVLFHYFLLGAWLKKKKREAGRESKFSVLLLNTFNC
jgi:hypothetical protein